jgi:hypothetical protein|tara:strand:+ start:859 stop:1623 length:765 start_codon:yes stop_codon:yes gene_type:complete
MKLSAERIQENWNEFTHNIINYISSPRKEQLIEFYNKYQDRLILMPAAHKKEYHNAFPGGYIDHVNRVVKAALELSYIWDKFGCDMTTFTDEELVFSAINHDLGKMGSEEQDSYIPQTDKWRRDKLGEDYMFNNKVEFASVPDRGLFLLQSHGIKYNFNEMVAIQTHDGLYDSANDKYLKGWMPEQKPRTSLPFILHQADMMAARIEFEMEWLPKFKSDFKKSDNFTIKTNKSTKSKALSSISSPGLKDMLKKL